MMELIIAPNVPPNANAYIPKIIKANKRIKSMTSHTKDRLKIVGEIYNNSKLISVFLFYKYL